MRVQHRHECLPITSHNDVNLAMAGKLKDFNETRCPSASEVEVFDAIGNLALQKTNRDGRPEVG